MFPHALHFVSIMALRAYIWVFAPLYRCIRAAAARVLLRSDYFVPLRYARALFLQVASMAVPGYHAQVSSPGS